MEGPGIDCCTKYAACPLEDYTNGKRRRENESLNVNGQPRSDGRLMTCFGRAQEQPAPNRSRPCKTVIGACCTVSIIDYTEKSCLVLLWEVEDM